MHQIIRLTIRNNTCYMVLAAGSLDAALLFNADAGSVYTVHVSGVNNGTGEALVEVYEVP